MASKSLNLADVSDALSDLIRKTVFGNTTERLAELERRMESLEEQAEIFGLDIDSELELYELEAEYNKLRTEAHPRGIVIPPGFVPQITKRQIRAAMRARAPEERDADDFFDRAMTERQNRLASERIELEHRVEAFKRSFSEGPKPRRNGAAAAYRVYQELKRKQAEGTDTETERAIAHLQSTYGFYD